MSKEMMSHTRFSIACPAMPHRHAIPLQHVFVQLGVREVKPSLEKPLDWHVNEATRTTPTSLKDSAGTRLGDSGCREVDCRQV